MTKTTNQLPSSIETDELILLESSYIEYCSCKVSRMVDGGRLVRDTDGELYYSEYPRTHDELQDALMQKELPLVTQDLAVELGIGSKHWYFVSILKSIPIAISDNARVTVVKARE